MEFLGPIGSEIGQRLALSLRLTDGFVIEIGDIAHVFDRCAIDFEHAAERVLDKESAEVADMCRAVDCGAAAIETQSIAAHGGERLNRAAKCIVKFDGHGAKE